MVGRLGAGDPAQACVCESAPGAPGYRASPDYRARAPISFARTTTVPQAQHGDPLPDPVYCPLIPSNRPAWTLYEHKQLTFSSCFARAATREAGLLRLVIALHRRLGKPLQSGRGPSSVKAADAVSRHFLRTLSCVGVPPSSLKSHKGPDWQELAKCLTKRDYSLQLFQEPCVSPVRPRSLISFSRGQAVQAVVSLESHSGARALSRMR